MDNPYKVVLVCPTHKPLKKIVLESFKKQECEILISMDKPDKTLPKHFNIVNSRNKARLKALEIKADFYFWVDSDVVLPDDALKNLLKEINRNIQIIGGWYKLKGENWSAGKWIGDNLFMQFNRIIPGINIVDKIEMGCILMNREILEKIEFKRGHTVIFNKDRFACECMMFAIDAQDLGYNLYMTDKVVCKHLNK